ncbi:MAG: hypothetical protein V3R73_00270 [Sphingomonadales bacterium]
MQTHSYRDWIEDNRFPMARAPGPGWLALFLVVSANVLLWAFAGPALFWSWLLATGLGASGFAAALFRGKMPQPGWALALIAATAGAAGLAAFYGLGGIEDRLFNHLALTITSVLLGLAYLEWLLLKVYGEICEESDSWGIGGLAAYADYLVTERPGFGDLVTARELYRTAAEEALKERPPSPDGLAAINAYAALLSDGVGGRRNRQEAGWWRAKVIELDDDLVDSGPTEPGEEEILARAERDLLSKTIH